MLKLDSKGGGSGFIALDSKDLDERYVLKTDSPSSSGQLKVINFFRQNVSAVISGSNIIIEYTATTSCFINVAERLKDTTRPNVTICNIYLDDMHIGYDWTNHNAANDWDRWGWLEGNLLLGQNQKLKYVLNSEYSSSSYIEIFGFELSI